MSARCTVGLLVTLSLMASPALAQPLGTFRWNVAPFCSVLTLNVTQQGAVFTMDGFEEQCGGNARLPAVGIAVPQADGTVLIGVTTVTEDGDPLHTRASVSAATISGGWEDDAGNSGSFVFDPGATTGGPRPGPVPGLVPPAFTLNADGGFDIDGGFGVGAIPSVEPGARFMWYSRKAAFRAGTNQAGSWDDASIGTHSVALGFGSRASGDRSTALGSLTIASGFASLATGSATTASGNFTTAMGFNASTNGFDGAFVYGDNSAGTLLTASQAHQFNVRASGGARVFTNSTLTAGVTVAPGGGSWGAVSDVNLKERFRDLDGDEVLAKLAVMPVREWSYKSQDASIRHRAGLPCGIRPRRRPVEDHHGRRGRHRATGDSSAHRASRRPTRADRTARSTTTLVQAGLPMIRGLALVMIVATTPALASAQALGAFRWQLQPYCNVVTLTVSQVGGVFTLDGFDDQCGASQRASVAGTASFNPDGSIGLGLAIVTAPGAIPLHVAIALSLATVSGTWRDSSGASGTFAFNPVSVGGSPRPAPIGAFAAGLIVGTSTFLPDGSFVARGVEDVGALPASGAGLRAMWYASRGAFRAGQVDSGQWDDPGPHSAAFGFNTEAERSYTFAAGYQSRAEEKAAVAMGSNTVASGQYSTALGNTTRAMGEASIALGSGSTASGEGSTTMGGITTASGPYSLAGGFGSTASGNSSLATGYYATASGARSTALGQETTASGLASIAAGGNVTASSDYSVALGKNVSTSTRSGSFIFGDNSGVATTVPTANNQFVVRATGGVRFLTSTTLVNGCEIAPTTGNFVCTGTITSSSDRRRKHEVALLDGEDVLDRVARIPVTTWSFIDEPGVRHAGPMAQDFHAAFGLGENDVTISYVDINGINMRAIQALEQRTRDLMAEVAALRAELATIKSARR